MGIIEDAEKFAFNVCARKISLGAGKAVVSVLAGAVAQHYLTQLGVQYDPVKLQLGLIGLVMGAIEGIHDWAKLKYPEVVKF